MTPRTARLAAAVLLAGALVTAGAHPGADTGGASQAGLEVPSRFTGSHALAHVELDDTTGAWLILDSGAQLSVIDARVASRLTRQASGTSRLSGYGGSRLEGGVLRDLRFRVAGAPPFATTTPVADLSALDRHAGYPLEGFLGAPLFDRFVVEIDYQAQRVLLHDRGGFRPRPSDVRLALTVDRATPFVEGELTFEDGSVVRGRFVLDTGMRNAISLATPFVAAHGLPAKVGRMIPQRVAGIGGAHEEQVGRVAALRLGAITLPAPIVQWSSAPEGLAAAADRAGAIGGDVLRRFTATIDFRGRALYLRPNDARGEPFEADMSGLSLVARGDNPRVVAVDHVAAGSPASAAGLEAGDVIETVDGAALALWELRERLRQEPGRVRTLGVRRNGVRIEVLLTLERRV